MSGLLNILRMHNILPAGSAGILVTFFLLCFAPFVKLALAISAALNSNYS